MTKLIVAYIVENDKEIFDLSYESINDHVDDTIVIDGAKYKDHEKPIRYMDAYFKDSLLVRDVYEHKYKGANGKQRNKYLKILKEKYMGDWCLVLDSDEVVQFPERIKKIIEVAEKGGVDCISPKMRHLFWNLGWEDATRKEHFVPCRLFKITKDLKYPEVEHPVLHGWKKHAGAPMITIWHLSDARQCIRFKKTFLNNVEKSNIHKLPYLKWWLASRLLGDYPVKRVNPEELPEVMRKYFLLDDNYCFTRKMLFDGVEK